LSELIVDFESMKANGFNLKEAFEYQGWLSYFEILNCPTYTNPVKDFWVTTKVFDLEDADKELAQ